MMLRSSSTPLLRSLLSESPSNHHHHQHSDLAPNHTPNSIHHSYTTLSCNHGGYQNYTKILYPSNSPISPSVSELSNGRQLTSHGIRRAQSEGNLEVLAKASTEEVDEFSLSKLPKTLVRKPHKAFLETIPSFNIHNSREFHSDDDSYDEEDEDDDFGYISKQYSLGTIGVKEEMSYVSQNSKLEFVEGREEMYLARGIGIADIGCFDDGGPYGGWGNGGGGGGYRPVAFDREGGGDSQGLRIEEYYKRMLEENPGNSLFLRNYANFLYQTKKDLKGAEEYYSRAILADPSDGEILSQYAKLIWELHRDEDRATSYFERAVQAASSDSHIHAAYANFLWEIEDENDDIQAPRMLHTVATASITA
ncbi:PREDICTED: uncharacterized protein LOC109242409 [Nicotiana attenuata]|uniref:Uncharacterized protein n=1 Tax=Nicotiana attenuata TaxID=49451 RepID=A0A314L3R0_NICAT|nr:PREDICTED: uncharacterized protein LOC109242409 [Nicotiana attenuata]OIT36152.1 hypothetical protein A4A49_05981 [Nicotiana attenuata]